MLKNMKIGKKLMIAFLFVAVLSSVGGIVGLSIMANMNSSYSGALVSYGFAQGSIGLFNTEFNNNRSIVRDIIYETDPQEMQASSDELNSSNAKLAQYFVKMKPGMVTDKEIGYYNNIKDNLTKYGDVRVQVVNLKASNKTDEAYQLLKDQTVPIANTIRTSIEALINEKTTTGNQLSSTLTAQGDMAKLAILAVIFGSFILSFFISLTIARSFSRPVRQMADAAKKMAEGDLRVQVDVSSKDEIGQLGSAFVESAASIRSYIADITNILGEMERGNLTAVSELEYPGDYADLKNASLGILSSLNDTLSQINQAAEQVSDGSGQVSGGAQSLAQGAAEQASSVEELSATITEISAHVKENAEHAAMASLNVNHVSSEIEASNNYMSEMIAAMSRINGSSNEIGKIIKTIEDIAFQTNILALNAAVEAARAGAAGKGFAVVADEVRNLAAKSAEAAKSTTALIENSMKQVENGTRIAGETAESLLRVVKSAGNVAETVEKISQVSKQQSDAIDQVKMGVDQISNVIQTNSATAEESAAASEELSRQAQGLKILVRKFKLRDAINQNSQPELQRSKPAEIDSNSVKY